MVDETKKGFMTTAVNKKKKKKVVQEQFKQLEIKKKL